jgi:hypothetical protein
MYIQTLNFRSYSTFASSAPSSATGAIIKEFNIPKEVSYLITTVFLLGYVFGVGHFTYNLAVLFT